MHEPPAQDHPAALRQASVHAAGENQNAGFIWQRYLGLNWPALTFEGKAFGVRLAVLAIDLGRSGSGVNSAVAQDAARLVDTLRSDWPSCE